MLSIVIPIYNEEKLIAELVKRTHAALTTFTSNFEIIVVDDGSEDDSLKNLQASQVQFPELKIVALSRNFGHQAAYTAGLEYASGEFIGMMDGDMQDPPELFADMYRKIKEEGFDVISAKRTGRKGSNSRNLLTFIFHRIFRNIAVLKNMENTGNFSMMTREALSALLTLKEKIRYLPGLRTFIGYKQGYVEFIREDRLSGEPKMSLSKLFTLAADAIFSFSKLPIRMCLILGLIGTFVFMCAGAYVLFAKIMGFAIAGWPSTMLSIYFLGSIQLVALGIVGEYVYRIYKESQERPLYFVKKIYDGTSVKK